LQALAITGIEIAFDVFTQKISYMRIGGKIAIGCIELNSTLLLPDLSLSGSLVSFGEQKEPLVKISAKKFLENMNLPAFDLPELSINWVQFFVNPKESSYSVELDLAGTWAFDDKIKLEDLDLKFGYSQSGISCKIFGTLKLFGKFDIYASAENSAAGGWTFDGKTKPEQVIGLDELAEDILRTFNVELPFKLPEIKIKDAEIKFNTFKKDFLFKVTMTEFSLGKLNITGIPLLNNVKVENAAFTLEIKNGGSPTGLIKGEVVIDNTRFCIFFEKTAEGVGFKGSIKDVSIDIENIGKNLLPDLKSLVPIPKIEISEISVDYHSKGSAFTFAADIKNKLSYKFSLKTLPQIELSKIKFICAANNTSVSAALSCLLNIGGTEINFIVKLSNKGFYLESNLDKGFEIDLPSIVEYFFGKNALSIFDSVPAEYRVIAFNQVLLKIDTGQGIASFSANSEKFGGAEFSLQYSKDGNPGFVIALIPPSKIPFSKVHESLKVLDGINIDGTCLLISSISQPKLTLEKLKSTVKEDKIVQGLNLFATMNLNNDTDSNLSKEAQDVSAMGKELSKLIKLDNLTIHGSIGFDPADILIEGYIGSFSIYDSGFKLENAGLRLSADGVFAVFGSISFDFEKYTGIPWMCFTGVMKLYANGIEIDAIWRGSLGTKELKKLAESCEDITTILNPEELKKMNELVGTQISSLVPAGTIQNISAASFESLGIISQLGHISSDILKLLPEIEIKEIGLILGCDWEGIPSGGCIGRFTVNGDKPENEGLVAFLMNSNNPLQSILQAKFPKDFQETLIQLYVKFRNLISEPEETPAWAKLIKLNGFEYDGKWIPLQIKIALMNVMIGDTLYKKGIIIQGRVVIFSFLDIIMNLSVDTEVGVRAFGRMKPIQIKYNDSEILEITKVDDELLSVDRVLKEKMEEIKPIYNGPLFDLSIPLSLSALTSSYMKFNGKLKLLGLEVIQTDCEISTKEVHFDIKGLYPFEYQFSCGLKSITSFYAKGRVIINPRITLEKFQIKSNDFNPPEIGNFYFQIDISLEGTKFVLILKAKFMVSDPFSLRQEEFTSSEYRFEVVLSLNDMVNNVTQLVKTIIIEAYTLTCAAFLDELNRIKNLLSHLVDIVAIQLYKAIEEIKRNMELIANEIMKLIAAISILQATIDQILRELEEARHVLSDIGYAIANKKLELDRALNDLAYAVTNCVLGPVEDAIIRAEEDAVNAYNNAEQNRINAYNERRTWSSWINWFPSRDEFYWKGEADRLYVPMMAAQIAAAPVRVARSARDFIHNELNNLYDWEKQQIDIVKDFENRYHEQLDKKLRSEELLSAKRNEELLMTNSANEKIESLNENNRQILDLQQKQELFINKVKDTFIDEMKTRFSNLSSE
jgi:hypothetical protein